MACGQTYVFWHKELEADRGAPSTDDDYNNRDDGTLSLLKTWRWFGLGLEECSSRFTHVVPRLLQLLTFSTP